MPPLPSGSSIRLVSHDPYLDIEILLPPLINKTAPTFIGTVPCRLIEKDLNFVIVHDDLLHDIVNEHLGFKSQGLLIIQFDFLGRHSNCVLAFLNDDLPVKFFLSGLKLLQTLGGRVGDHTAFDSRHDVFNGGLDLPLLAE